ncbi:MAG: metalloregulator ArsR/SmtB family transcription factor [Hyphomicrobium sp.]
MSSESPKRLLFRQFASIAKAVAHEHRLELLEAMAQGERSVEALAERTGLSLANASHHLQQMRRAGLIEARREGKYVVHHITDSAVIELVATLTRIGERHVAAVGQIVRSYFDARDGMEPVTRAELSARMKAGVVQVLDVRPEDEFAMGHLPGAINIPLDRLKKRLSQLDPGKEIVAYCRGPYCVLSFETVAILRKKGFNVRRLEDGLPEWRAAGLPIDLTPSS